MSDQVKKAPGPHRCNARLEDIVQAVVSLSHVGYTISNFAACMRSEPGKEPVDPYFSSKAALMADLYASDQRKKEQQPPS
jgi:hypothetical protein